MEHRRPEGAFARSPWMILLLVIAMMGFWALTNPVSIAGAQTTDDTIIDNPPAPPGYAIGFARYDGVDGESGDANHDKWIDILSIDWGANKPGGGATGQSRRRGAAVVEDVVITFSYEKASPKLEEKMLKGEVIPKLEIELPSANQQVYLKYEFKNVTVTSFRVTAPTAFGDRAMATMTNNFEEVKVTYTEYDDEGQNKGNVEYEWKVEKGSK